MRVSPCAVLARSAKPLVGPPSGRSGPFDSGNTPSAYARQQLAILTMESNLVGHLYRRDCLDKLLVSVTAYNPCSGRSLPSRVCHGPFGIYRCRNTNTSHRRGGPPGVGLYTTQPGVSLSTPSASRSKVSSARRLALQPSNLPLQQQSEVRLPSSGPPGYHADTVFFVVRLYVPHGLLFSQRHSYIMINYYINSPGIKYKRMFKRQQQLQTAIEQQ